MPEVEEKPSPILTWKEIAGVAIAVLMAYLLVGSLQGFAPRFTLDDSYITAHNAQVLLSGGHDANYGNQPAITGASSLVHLALVTILSIPFGPLVGLSVAMWLAIFGFAVGCLRLCKSLGATTLASALFTLGAMVCAQMVTQWLNGLETGLAMTTVLWALILLESDGDRSWLWLAALCGLMPFVRPELVALSPLLLIAAALKPTTNQERLRRLGTMAGISALCALPWLGWSWLSVGHLAPATIEAKRAWFAEAGFPADVRTNEIRAGVLGFLIPFGLWGGCALGLLARLRVLAVFVVFATLFLFAYWRDFPGGPMQLDGRYLYPFAAFLVFGAASLMRWLSAGTRLISAGALCCWSLVYLGPAWVHYQTNLRLSNDLASVADWCNQNLPAGSVLLVHDAGYLAYATHFRLDDMVGLKTPANVEANVRWTLPSSGRDRPRALDAIARTGHVDVLVCRDQWESFFEIPLCLRAMGWKLEPLRPEGAYHVYRLSPPPTP